MRANVVRIGNSRGVRIPKALLEQCGIVDAVDITIDDRRLVLSPIGRPREGWAEAAGAAAVRGDDRLLEPATTTAFDAAEWEW